MKKIAVLVIVILVGVGAYIALNRESANVVGNKTTNSAAVGQGNYKYVDACTVLDRVEAEAQLGPGAKKGDGAGGNANSDDIAVSSCVYYTTSTTTNSYKAVTLLARSAKTKAGAESNISNFRDLKPPNVIDVPGFADAAFWSPEYGQMHVLAGDNWYIISTGSSRASERKQADAQALVTRLQPNL